MLPKVLRKLALVAISLPFIAQANAHEITGAGASFLTRFMPNGQGFTNNKPAIKSIISLSVPVAVSNRLSLRPLISVLQTIQ